LHIPLKLHDIFIDCEAKRREGERKKPKAQKFH
jgi:hypothetical protein